MVAGENTPFLDVLNVSYDASAVRKYRIAHTLLYPNYEPMIQTFLKNSRGEKSCISNA
jgi:hypothetical protein